MVGIMACSIAGPLAAPAPIPHKRSSLPGWLAYSLPAAMLRQRLRVDDRAVQRAIDDISPAACSQQARNPDRKLPG
jgi:hypothetical protein